MRIKLDCPIPLSLLKLYAPQITFSRDRTIEYVTTDSREAKEGDLYFPIKGESYDGNSFLRELFERGVVTLSDTNEYTDVFAPGFSLLDFSRIYKDCYASNLIHTVGITGSVGKTTTKNLTAALISPFYKTHATMGNYNNRIGVSHTLLGLKRDTEILIAEMGMNSMGEIAELSRAVRPTIAVITNIGSAHIGNLGTRESIAKAKMEITAGMSGGVLYCEANEPLLAEITNRTTLSFDNGDADCKILNLREENYRHVFDFHHKSGIIKNIKCPLFGKHIIKALGFALSIALEIGIDAESLKQRVGDLSEDLLTRRFIPLSDFTILDDSYNCSLESLRADLEYMRLLNFTNKSLLLGDMLELGDKAEEIHRAAGALAAEYGISRLYLLGRYANYTASGAEDFGFDKSRIFINEDPIDRKRTAEQIFASHLKGELILLKASHRLNLSAVAELLKELDKNNDRH